jgi:alpha-amylase
MTVYYHSDTMASPTVYFWNLSGSSATTSWPGEPMASEGNGWYSYSFASAESASLIFSDSGNNQTDDLSRSGTGWYKGGSWFNENPDGQGDNGGEDLVLYYFNSGNFTAPTAYFWENDSAAGTSWPGEPMIDEGKGWFSISISDATETNIIFSDNGANQTDDLYRSGNGYYKDGIWTSTMPEDAAGLTIHYRNTTGWSTPTVYFWGNDSAAQTSWPGEVMTEEADGWFVYTIDDASESNLIFSDNGAAQTPDLFRDSNGWYENGSWFNSPTAKNGTADDELPNTTALMSNYPNPFNPSTQIPFELAERSEVTLTVYSILGHEVASLVNSRSMNAGTHVVTFNADNLSSGIYIYRFQASGTDGRTTIEKGKMTLVK